MKKYSVILITIIISVPFGSDASINSNLNYGSTGEQVIELQQFLIKENYLKASATGDFYSLTLRAVKAFQKANDISATGYVGPLTRAAVNSWSSKGGTATVVNPTQSVSECPLGYSCVRSSSVQLQALAVSSANDNVSAKGSASITFSSATNQSAFNVSANGQHLNLPILTTYVTPSSNIYLRTLTVKVEASGQGSITNPASLYQWNPYAGSKLIATGNIVNGTVTFTNNPANDQQITFGPSSPNTLSVKVDVFGLNNYGDSETIKATIIDGSGVDSTGQNVDVIGIPQISAVTVANNIVPTPSVSVNMGTDSSGGSTINWTSTNATSCTLDSSPILLVPSGSQRIYLNWGDPTKATPITHTVTCTGKYGSGSGSVTIQPPPTCTVLPTSQYYDPQSTTGFLINGQCLPNEKG